MVIDDGMIIEMGLLLRCGNYWGDVISQCWTACSLLNDCAAYNTRWGSESTYYRNFHTASSISWWRLMKMVYSCFVTLLTGNYICQGRLHLCTVARADTTHRHLSVLREVQPWIRFLWLRELLVVRLRSLESGHGWSHFSWPGMNRTLSMPVVDLWFILSGSSLRPIASSELLHYLLTRCAECMVKEVIIYYVVTGSFKG